MTVETRLLTLHDVALVSRVAPEVFDGPVRPERSRAFLEDPRHHLIVAIDADQVVGFVSAVDYVHPDKAPELWINEMGVAPPYQRRGIGRRLLRAMLDHARAIGCVKAWLATEEGNAAARNLYESLGGDGERQLIYTFALAPETSDARSQGRDIADTARPDALEPPAVLVVTGASGAGKTTLVGRLAALGLPDVGCYEFDEIGIPSDAEIEARFGREGFQAWALGEWAARLARNADRVRVAVLDAQVGPRAALDMLARHGIGWRAVVLIDCAYAERNARLRGPRGQPELATARMDGWAAYLRGQADALKIPVLDTTAASLDESVAALRTHVEGLLDASAPVTRRAAG
jgi:ribosomal protein S18 acetylase RimI-like enzyme/energy-coupling factor transporter ATP-binding protein EcfA2